MSATNEFLLSLAEQMKATNDIVLTVYTVIVVAVIALFVGVVIAELVNLYSR